MTKSGFARKTKDKRLGYLEDRKRKLEARETIQEYLSWVELPEIEKDRIRLDWLEYYRQSKQTSSAKLFRLMRKAFQRKDIRLIRRIRDMARNIRENNRWELLAPGTRDPLEFEYGQIFNDYRRVLDEIALLNPEQEEEDELSKIFS